MDTKFLRALAEILIEVASSRKTITYSELSSRFCSRFREEYPPQFWRTPLGIISRICVENGLPPISAIVVNQQTEMPGEGFFHLVGELRGLGEIPMKEWESVWTDELRQVHECREWKPLLALLTASDRGAPGGHVAPFTQGEKPRMRLTAASDTPEPQELLRRAALVTTGYTSTKSESPAHERLKERIASDPAVLGVVGKFVTHTEYLFPSGDRADVVLDSDTEQVVVEVEVNGLTETTVGLFQAVKYRALTEAVNAVTAQTKRVSAFLVAVDVPDEVKAMAHVLGVIVREIEF